MRCESEVNYIYCIALISEMVLGKSYQQYYKRPLPTTTKHTIKHEKQSMKKIYCNNIYWHGLLDIFASEIYSS